MNLPETQKTPILRRVYQTAAGRRDDRVWQEAWLHIKDHLSPQPDKPTHGIFLKKYRSEAGVAGLIAQAASAPSDSEFGALTGPGGGAPCLIFRRWFNQDIGEDNIRTLWVIARIDGTLVTAYPRHHTHLHLQ